MTFLDTIKKLFVYSGEPDESDDTSTQEASPTVKPRVDLVNPIVRAKDIYASSVDKFKSKIEPTLQTVNHATISDYTTNVLCSIIHSNVIGNIESKPSVADGRDLIVNLFKDSTNHHNTTGEYSLAVLEFIRDLKNSEELLNITTKGLCDIITNNEFYLNIIEVLDYKYGYKIMKELETKSLFIVGHAFGEDNVKENSISINGSTFYLSDETSKYINNDASTEDKIAFIRNKTADFFYDTVAINNIPTSTLAFVYSLFNSYVDEYKRKVAIAEPTAPTQVNPVSTLSVENVLVEATRVLKKKESTITEIITSMSNFDKTYKSNMYGIEDSLKEQVISALAALEGRYEFMCIKGDNQALLDYGMVQEDIDDMIADPDSFFDSERIFKEDASIIKKAIILNEEFLEMLDPDNEFTDAQSLAYLMNKIIGFIREYKNAGLNKESLDLLRKNISIIRERL